MNNEKTTGHHAYFEIVVKEMDGLNNEINLKLEGCAGCLVSGLAATMLENPALMNVIKDALGRAVMLKMQAAMKAEANPLSKDGIHQKINSNLN